MAIIRKTITGLKPDTNYLFTVKPKNAEIVAADDLPDAIRVKVPAYSGTPPKISNLILASNFQSVIFKFDPINDIDLDYYEYQLFDVNPGPDTVPLDSVVSLVGDGENISGINKANVFVISVENSTTLSPEEVTSPTRYWGRVRAVNTARNASSDWSDLAMSSDTPLIDEQFIGSLTAAKITSGEIGAAEITLNGANSIIQSSASPGWFIEGDGFFNFGGLNGISYDGSKILIGTNVEIDADLEINANEVTVNTAYGSNILRISESLNDATPAMAGLSVGSIPIGSTPNNHWLIDGSFRVGGSEKYIYWNPVNQNVTVSGQINATSGNIGEWSITDEGLFNVKNETITNAAPGENILYNSSVEIYPPGFKEYVGDNVKSFSSINQTAEWRWEDSLFNPDNYSYTSDLSSDNLSIFYRENILSATPSEFFYNESRLNVDGLLLRTGDTEADIETALGKSGVFIQPGLIRFWGEPLSIFSESPVQPLAIGPVSTFEVSANSDITITSPSLIGLNANTIEVSATGSGSSVAISGVSSSITASTINITSAGSAFGITTITSGSSRHTLISGGSTTSLSANTGRLIIGANATGAHLSIDGNTIQAKATGTTAAGIEINPLGGITDFGFDIRVKGDILRSNSAPGIAFFTYTAAWSNAATGGELGRLSSSSARYKENISYEISSDLDPNKILDLSVVQFDYKPEFVKKDINLKNRTLIGLLAEDVNEKYPVACLYDEEGNPENFFDRALVPAMLKVIQDLSKKVAELEKRLL